MSAGAGRIALTRWLVAQTGRLLFPLLLAAVLRIAGQLLGIALLLLAVGAVVEAWSGAPQSALSTAAVLVAIALAKALLRYLEQYAGHWVAFRALQRLRELFFARLVPQAPAATTGAAGAELTERATRDIDRIEVFFAHAFPPAVGAVVTPAIVLGWFAATTDAATAATLAIFVLAGLLVPVLAAGGTWSAARIEAERRGEVVTVVGDDIQGVGDVLAFDAAAQRGRTRDRAVDALTASRARQGRISGVRAFATTALQLLSVIAVGAIAVARDAPPATVAAALALAVAIWGPARGIDDFTTGLDAAFAAAARLRAIVDRAPAVTDPPRPRSFPAIADPADPADPGTPARHATIAFEHVTCRFDDRTDPALDDIDAELPLGEWTSVVGVSGSGKSTLAELLVRVRDPDEGRVLLAGTDLATLALDELRARVTLVPQHPDLVSGTIGDNLRLAAPTASDAVVADALRVADLDAWVAALPDGLGTRTTALRGGVSGGQLQRLALARALVAEPDILVLDEALSQLDARTLALVRDRLAAARPHTTIVEVTHRADLVPPHGAVIVLDRGRLVERGTAGQLRAARGAFARLVERV